MHDSLSGSLVVASPRMDDPNFDQAVVLMVEHSDDGAMGLILNKPMQTKVAEIWDQVSVLPCPVDQPLMAGGPCEGPLMLLHSERPKAQIEVCEGVYFTAGESMVRELLAEGPTPIRYFTGYAGWGPGQLESELDLGGWLVTRANASIVFDSDSDDGRWMRVIKGIDRSLAMLAMNPKLVPRDPSMN